MTMQQEWQDYCKRVYPKGMSEQQRKELYQCFFAAQLALLLRIRCLCALHNGNADMTFNAEMDKIFREVSNECEYICVGASTGGQQNTAQN